MTVVSRLPDLPNRVDPPAPGSLTDRFVRDLAAIEGAGRLRTTNVEAAGHGAVDFSSNDYLGLSRHPDVVAAAIDAAAEYGAGGRAARLLGGGSPLVSKLERRASLWLGSEAALVFPSGYQANLGALTALAGSGDVIFSDADNHASLIDGSRLSRARVVVYPHGDPAALERRLRLARGARSRIVVTESVFSMAGDSPPLGDLHRLCEMYDAYLIVDEAHAVGLLGPEGSGVASELGLQDRGDRLLARVVTGGKALGAGGALVASSDLVRSLLVNRARSSIFTTAPPPALVGALTAAIEIVRSDGALRSKPRRMARRFARRVGAPDPAAGIVFVEVGEENRAVAAASRVLSRGFDVRAVRPPTVSPGRSGLRVVAHADQVGTDADRLAEVLAPLRSSVRSRRPRKACGTGPLVVAGTDTGVGKTVVSALILRSILARGLDGRYFKPVQTGYESDTDTVLRLAGAPLRAAVLPEYEFTLAASPHEAAAAEAREIDPDLLVRLIAERVAESPDGLVLELAGGVMVPLTDPGFMQVDLCRRIGGSVVLVARSGVGTLNHTLLTVEALRARGIEPAALFLVGAAHSGNRRTLGKLAGIDRIYEVPPLVPLDRSALDVLLVDMDLASLAADPTDSSR